MVCSEVVFMMCCLLCFVFVVKCVFCGVCLSGVLFCVLYAVLCCFVL